MRRTSLAAVWLAACAVASGCTASTKMLTTWKDPEVNNVRFKRILVIAATKNDPMRRSMETQVARAVSAGEVSYNLVPTDDLDDVAKVKPKVEASGADGLLVVRIRSVDRDLKVIPGGTGYGGYGYGGAWGYWGAPGYTAYTATRVEQDTQVVVETNVYSVADAKLIWTSRSRTTNPDDIHDLIESIADETREEMRAQGLLPATTGK
ncbi:MAG: hypothetical protein IPK07_10700 [Deltaproteobacteria bacterium]|nr:hypothetical protein [Deltaproteobacteria bacterium]